MDMDMDMDLGWCLACSKRTRDARSPYCSDACRTRDVHPELPSESTTAITSPLPPKFAPLPPTTPGGQQVDRRPSLVSASSCQRARLDAAARLQQPPSTPDAAYYNNRRHHPRDRRAFSFPASDASAESGSGCGVGVDRERPVGLAFARKAKPINAGTPRSLKKHNHHFSSEITTRLSMSTGANTPDTLPLESTFYSTSDSEKGDEPSARAPTKAKADRAAPPSPLLVVSALHPTAKPMRRLSNERPVSAVSQATSLSSQLHQSVRPLEPRSATSAVTRMGSSSSRSREDIISWARGVDARGGEVRGRRGRRPDALANLPPPSTEPLDEPTSTTPKSAGPFGALNMATVVNALRSVSFGPTNAAANAANAAAGAGASASSQEQPSALGLQAVPAHAAVSRVEVMVGTRVDEFPLFAEGDTPTLSTVSFSEAVDPSTTTDIAETVESTADDYSVVSSHGRGSFSPRAGGGATGTSTTTPTPSTTNVRQKSSLPLRPIQTTASAIWSFSTYLRSLAPFTTPFSLVTVPSSPTEPLAAPSALSYEEEPVVAALPLTQAMPTGRVDVTEDVDPAQELVRSVPMDIVIAMGSKAQAITEERAREREVLEFLGPSSRGRTRIDASRSPSVDTKPTVAAAAPKRPTHARHTSYDADASESGAAEPRGRGRGRTRSDNSAVASGCVSRDDAPTPTEEQRGRRRARGGESRDRSWSAHRGRSARGAVRA